MAHILTMALAVALLSEPAWWEGQWVDAEMSCEATAGDARPFRLSWTKLEFVESECVPLAERQSGNVLLLTAKCREHGDSRPRARTFTLQPLELGRAMILDSAGAEWTLRKCPTLPIADHDR